MDLHVTVANRRVGRPKTRWKDNVTEDTRLLKAKKWRYQTQGREFYKKFLMEASAQIGLSCQIRKWRFRNISLLLCGIVELDYFLFTNA